MKRVIKASKAESVHTAIEDLLNQGVDPKDLLEYFYDVLALGTTQHILSDYAYKFGYELPSLGVNVNTGVDKQEIEKQIEAALYDLLGDVWHVVETVYDTRSIEFDRRFQPDEANNDIVPEAKKILKYKDLWKYISSVRPFYSGSDPEAPEKVIRIAVSLKREFS